MSLENARQKMPTWFWVATALALLWNIFGVFQFVQSILATKENLIAMGMTDTQAELMKGYPLWLNVAFGVGTIGGLIGTVLLGLRKNLATPVLAFSLLGYVVLYVGDITEGVFAALGVSQVIILTIVVLIAAALFLVCRSLQRKGRLR